MKNKIIAAIILTPLAFFLIPCAKGHFHLSVLEVFCLIAITSLTGLVSFHAKSLASTDYDTLHQRVCSLNMGLFGALIGFSVPLLLNQYLGLFAKGSVAIKTLILCFMLLLAILGVFWGKRLLFVKHISFAQYGFLLKKRIKGLIFYAFTMFSLLIATAPGLYIIKNNALLAIWVIWLAGSLAYFYGFLILNCTDKKTSYLKVLCIGFNWAGMVFFIISLMLFQMPASSHGPMMLYDVLAIIFGSYGYLMFYCLPVVLFICFIFYFVDKNN